MSTHSSKYLAGTTTCLAHLISTPYSAILASTQWLFLEFRVVTRQQPQERAVQLTRAGEGDEE